MRRVVGICSLAMGIGVISGCSNGMTGAVFENDLLADGPVNALTGKKVNSDRNFSYSLVRSWKPDQKKPPSIDILHGLALDKLPGRVGSCLNKSPTQNSLGVTAFTPDQLTDPNPILDDRPYASLLFYSSSQGVACDIDRLYKPPKGKLFLNNEYSTVYLSNFNTGILGAEIGKTIQRFAHNQLSVSSQDPRGWNNQISEGGEPTFSYQRDRLDLIKQGKKYDISRSAGFSIGYYTYVSAGLSFRYSLVEELFSPFYYNGGSNIPAGTYAKSSALIKFLKGMQDTRGISQPDRFVFLSTRLSAFAYNALLQGQFRDSEVEYSNSGIEPFVVQTTLGLSSDLNGWCKGIALGKKCNRWFSGSDSRLTFAIHHRSSEYKSISHGREHWWGGLYWGKGFGNSI